jgi:branched-subunit amino acid ABC-type transport system permease component
MTAQVVLNGLVTGMVVALPAVALTLIYGILKFPNFAIGAMLTVGAYLALALNVYLSLPVLYAAAIGAAVFSVVAVGIDYAARRFHGCILRAREHRALHLRQRRPQLRATARPAEACVWAAHKQ